MVAMDDVVAFLEAFARREFEVLQARWRERDEAAWQAAVAALHADFFAPPLSSGFFRFQAGDAHFAQAEEQLRHRMPRILYEVRRWRHPTLGELFAGYVSSQAQGRLLLTSRFFVRETAEGLRLIARQDVCPDCSGTGEQGGRVCAGCAGRGWRDAGGPVITDPGTLLETRELRAWEGT